MTGNGRENSKDNDLFYLCSLIDYIARKTKNVRSDIVNKLGKERLEKIYDLADVYHCDNIDRVSEDFTEECDIKKGTFDNVGDCGYAIPSHWDIGRVRYYSEKQIKRKEKPVSRMLSRLTSPTKYSILLMVHRRAICSQ